MNVKEWDILLPCIIQEPEGTPEQSQTPKTPYDLAGAAMNDLHFRSHEKMCTLFPGWPPYEIIKRINREVEALWSSPCVYALLIADDVIKLLRSVGLNAYLQGKWEASYYAYLMDLLPQDPVARGLSSKNLIKDGYIHAPVAIAVERQHRQRCIGLLKKRAHEWGFWLHPEGEYQWALISCGYRADDMFARIAPKLVLM